MSASPALIATDLDRTMIYSKNAIGGDPSGTDLGSGPAPVCVEYYDGGPLSHMSVDAIALLRELCAAVPVIPTTTRTIAQFQRIDLPGGPWKYAITSNGGNILVDGKPDLSWRSEIDRSTRAAGVELAHVRSELEARIDVSWVSSMRVADELFPYLVVDLSTIPTDFEAGWSDWCISRGWNVSRQGRKIYTVPDAVSKSRALAEVRRRLIESGDLAADATVLSAGDGALDADMLEYADFAIRPRHGELEELNWQRPTVTVTETSGIAASVEIVSWFSAHVAAMTVGTPQESQQLPQ
ncbi:HAD family hydrolase [Rhodococcus sp. IEGM 1379]|uniref:HAD family hydrolase n=1 Tax=Rhodococcus sp. IEGM 1379 TaxID=3047086 RepID=UPI0024B7E6A2|nr:HAD family hydrolase [Rhodococcus sp. IEGM 1379]MDI9919106.1 HAD family hydrolase [Rhodococcus sp. IEGM 1379]